MTEKNVLAAAAALIAAFAANDVPAYFAAFTPEASFIFHHVAYVMRGRAAYEAEYAAWLQGGFEVLECTSSRQTVQLYGDMAVFTHQLFTRTRSNAGETALHERETIIFRHIDGRWLGVHEHLSPLAMPGASIPHA